MGRWKQQDATVCIFGTVNCAFGENTSDARRIVDAHNADCDAYEARIAELEATVARVKAESLRVVPDGEERQAYRCSKVLHNGRICFVHTRTLDDYFQLQIGDFVTGKYVDKVYCETLLQPVRLERWEEQG